MAEVKHNPMEAFEGDTIKKKRKKAYDRITLKEEAIVRLSQWIEKVERTVKGIKITRSDLVNWLIMVRGPELSKRELGSIKEQFFDEIQFMEWALRKIKAAKQKKEELTLDALLQSCRQPPRKTRKVTTNSKDALDGSTLSK